MPESLTSTRKRNHCSRSVSGVAVTFESVASTAERGVDRAAHVALDRFAGATSAEAAAALRRLLDRAELLREETDAGAPHGYASTKMITSPSAVNFTAEGEQAEREEKKQNSQHLTHETSWCAPADDSVG